jgi:TonB family protein
MKKLLLLCTLALAVAAITSCNGGAVNETSKEDDSVKTKPYYIDRHESFDTSNLDTEIFIHSQVWPEFPGGEDSLEAFLKKNIRYPKKAKEQKIEGRVFVRFIVERDGSITDAKIMRDIVYGSSEADSLAATLGCGAEALRVIKMMPKWSPATHRGYKVRFQYTFPIQFRL